SADVRLVDDRPVPGHPARPGLALPIEVRIHDDALGHEWRTVARIKAQIVTLGTDGIAKARGVPLQLTDVPARIGVQDQLVRIEAMTRLGLVRPMDPKAVYGRRVNIRNVAVPELIGIFRQHQALELLRAPGIE